MNGIETIVSSAKPDSISLRTTIPVFVAEQMGLKKGDHIDWKVDKKGKKWIAIIKQK